MNDIGKFFIYHSAHPCTELVLDINLIRNYMVRAGYSEADSPSEADVLFVSTCAFNNEYERDAVEMISRAAAARKPGARVVVSGCLSKINPGLFSSFPDVVALPPSEMRSIEKLFPSAAGIDEISAHTTGIAEYQNSRMFMTGIKLKKFFLALSCFAPFFRIPSWLDTVPTPDWYFIRASSGCLGECSYCVIKRARGSVRSAPLESVLRQFREAVSKGARTISFAGDDTGCYGCDTGGSFPELLSEMVKTPGDYEINIRFVEPEWLIRYVDLLEPSFRTGRIASFCAPLQSGSQRILGLMKKRYRISDAVAVINHILKATRVRSVSSIAMVGFPTETPEDFRRSYELIDRSAVNFYQVLKYEGRPGAASEDIDGKVGEELKELRRQRFVSRMKLTKIACLPPFAAEKIVSARFGDIV